MRVPGVVSENNKHISKECNISEAEWTPATPASSIKV